MGQYIPMGSPMQVRQSDAPTQDRPSDSPTQDHSLGSPVQDRSLASPVQGRPSTLQRIKSQAIFYLVRPFALLAFKRRERREWRKIIPTHWLSQGELLTRDIENYEPQEAQELDAKFIEDFAKARDELLSQIKKQLIFSGIVFVYLASKYLDVGLGLSVLGFSITDTRGVTEGLLLASNLLACYTLILQGNVYLLETAIKHAITKTVPEELRLLYAIRYFPHEHLGPYRPFSLPHIVPNLPTRAIAQATSLLVLLLVVVAIAVFSTCSFFLLLHFLWFNARLGMVSYALLIFVLACGLYALLYFVLMRCRLPYLDYTINHELELLEQLNPERHAERLQEVYGVMNADRENMRRRGFLK